MAQSRRHDQKPKRWIFFDLEAQHSAAEVGGFKHLNRMGLSIAVAWEWPSQIFRVFQSSQTREISRLFRSIDLLIGYNIHRFDIPVLKTSGCRIPAKLPIIDVLWEIEERCGKRFSLDAMLEANFGIQQEEKDPLHNIKLWKKRRMVELVQECVNDVVGMHMLYEKLRDGSPLNLPSRFGPVPPASRSDRRSLVKRTRVQ